MKVIRRHREEKEQSIQELEELRRRQDYVRKLIEIQDRDKGVK